MSEVFGTQPDAAPEQGDRGVMDKDGTTRSFVFGSGADEVPTNAEFGGPTPAEIGRGAIVESGSNSNGHYVRWENGEQVCWKDEGDLDISQYRDDTTSQAIDIFRYLGVPWDFPADFSAPPYSNMTFRLRQQNTLTSVISTSSRSGSATFSIHSLGEEDTDELAHTKFFAWGFWK